MEELLPDLPAIRNILRKNKVVLAFLFGSAAEGKASKLSDLDLAVVLDKTTPQSQYHETRLLLLDQLGRVIKE